MDVSHLHLMPSSGASERLISSMALKGAEILKYLARATIIAGLGFLQEWVSRSLFSVPFSSG